VPYRNAISDASWDCSIPTSICHYLKHNFTFPFITLTLKYISSFYVTNKMTKHCNFDYKKSTDFAKTEAVCGGSAVFGAFANLQRFFVYTCLYVSSHGKTRFPLDGFSQNLISEYFSTICRGNDTVVKLWQEQRILYMKTYHIY
jgi:hypothetical protein